MDRLHALIVAGLLLTGCDDEAAVAPPPRSVSVAARSEPTVAFCDPRPAGAAPTTFAFPTLATPAPAPSNRVRWVNLWATWCRPCVEEMPLLAQWQQRFRADGLDVDMTFLSLDSSDEAVATFRREHPGTPESLRIADPSAAPAWLTTLGLDEGAPIPIQVIVDANQRVKCVRSGAVAEHHYDSARATLVQ